MISDEVSRVYFKKSDYDSVEDLFKDIGKHLEILIRNGNSTVVYALQDVKGVFVLEYSPIGLETIHEETQFPTWLDVRELSAVQISRISQKIEDLDRTKEELLDAKDEIEDTLAELKDTKKTGGDA